MKSHRITKDDILVSLLSRIVDESGEPIDISSDTITFSMRSRVPGSSLKVSAASANNDQKGDGETAITGITAADPPVVTSTSHGLSTGNRVLIRGKNLDGMAELKDREFTVTVVDANSFSLDGENATQHEAYVAGGIVSTRGFVSYDWAAGDVDTAGEYYGQFKRTSGGNTEHAPTGRELLIEIVEPI